MARKKQPTKDMANVKNLRGKIAHWTQIRDTNLEIGFTASAENAQKMIDVFKGHLEVEIGGSQNVEEVEVKSHFHGFINK